MLAAMGLMSKTSLKNDYFVGVEQAIGKMESDINRLQS